MELYEIRMLLTTEADMEKVELAIRSIENSGKVKVQKFYYRRLKPRGRPEVVKQEIIAFLQTQSKARSAIQIARKIERPQSSLYRLLNGLVSAGLVTKEYDAKWKTNRFKWMGE